MSSLVPIQRGESAFEQRVPLGEALFRMRFRWNPRAATWYLDLSTDAGDPLMTSVAIRVGVPLTSHSPDPRLPAGALIAVDTSGRGRDPGLDDLGARVPLLFIPYGEL